MITWEEIMEAKKSTVDKCNKIAMDIIRSKKRPLDIMNEVNETFTDIEKAIVVERFIFKSLKELDDQLGQMKQMKDDPAFS